MLFSILVDEILGDYFERTLLSDVNYKIAPHISLPVLTFMLNFFKRKKKKEDMACLICLSPRCNLSNNQTLLFPYQ